MGGEVTGTKEQWYVEGSEKESKLTVVRRRSERAPWCYVFGPPQSDDEGEVRAAMGYDVAQFLNGGARPRWFNDLDRPSPDVLGHPEGSKLIATGPMHVVNGKWQERQDARALAARRKLIDLIAGERWTVTRAKRRAR